ncbi:KilA domain-containing protein [Flavobacterium sp. 90]|uniref:KilA-N domain-containing protein n=1 Tax=unclassified Flavobacterium TaxID=196869 RepID=UPI000EB5C9AA|nr:MULTISPECIES: KilA-N domain-containing protein [unclassified Flavobacterium]RKR10067.1 KilA domain-containing protein [Flavobacterium sp. 81]TCK53852.1 KilA domain-containing protein [Flavobacterium sp. 90]
MSKNKKINVKGIDIVLYEDNKEDFISLTDIARHRDNERSDYILQNWMRNRSTIEFIGLWEKFNNPDFNSIEFDGIKNMAGSNSFSLTPKRWIESTNAIGIISKTGRYGGTFAHKDIAFEFATWLSAEFKFYLIKEFQRLKEEENSTKKLDWNLQRTISKINYRIHTDAIKENLIPISLKTNQRNFIYADEADILNVALFGKTAKQWRIENPDEKGNIRDIASIEQLVVLSNLESINAMLIQQDIEQNERLLKLNEIAISQMKSLINTTVLKNITS